MSSDQDGYCYAFSPTNSANLDKQSLRNCACSRTLIPSNMVYTLAVVQETVLSTPVLL